MSKQEFRIEAVWDNAKFRQGIKQSKQDVASLVKDISLAVNDNDGYKAFKSITSLKDKERVKELTHVKSVVNVLKSANIGDVGSLLGFLGEGAAFVGGRLAGKAGLVGALGLGAVTLSRYYQAQTQSRLIAQGTLAGLSPKETLALTSLAKRADGAGLGGSAADEVIRGSSSFTQSKNLFNTDASFRASEYQKFSALAPNISLDPAQIYAYNDIKSRNDYLRGQFRSRFNIGSKGDIEDQRASAVLAQLGIDKASSLDILRNPLSMQKSQAEASKDTDVQSQLIDTQLKLSQDINDLSLNLKRLADSFDRDGGISSKLGNLVNALNSLDPLNHLNTLAVGGLGFLAYLKGKNIVNVGRSAFNGARSVLNSYEDPEVLKMKLNSAEDRVRQTKANPSGFSKEYDAERIQEAEALRDGLKNRLAERAGAEASFKQGLRAIRLGRTLGYAGLALDAYSGLDTASGLLSSYREPAKKLQNNLEFKEGSASRELINIMGDIHIKSDASNIKDIIKDVQYTPYVSALSMAQ